MDRPKLKLCVFGAFNAGKSTFIQSLDPATRHIEANCTGGTTTVALDFGRVEISDRMVYLFGTPGQERFEFVRQILSRGMDGAIIIVDSTAGPDEITADLSVWLNRLGVPVVFMLNKCDMPDSTPSRFAPLVGDASVHLISAKNGENVREALSAFVDTIAG
ncbi:GTP-binding protein [Methanofollis fontis]|uniref:GTP-binding protein n=1 Tax=Methanofollis fontis TaxID=2052832 RepID=A0A483CXN2_9EURY|nr:GTP-binding protein [Methanofollis fontis]TAJ44699.1 GTP-binding protein [Methanofollis fontis]